MESAKVDLRRTAVNIQTLPPAKQTLPVLKGNPMPVELFNNAIQPTESPQRHDFLAFHADSNDFRIQCSVNRADQETSKDDLEWVSQTPAFYAQNQCASESESSESDYSSMEWSPVCLESEQSDVEMSDAFITTKEEQSV